MLLKPLLAITPWIIKASCSTVTDDTGVREVTESGTKGTRDVAACKRQLSTFLTTFKALNGKVIWDEFPESEYPVLYKQSLSGYVAEGLRRALTPEEVFGTPQEQLRKLPLFKDVSPQIKALQSFPPGTNQYTRPKYIDWVLRFPLYSDPGNWHHILNHFEEFQPIIARVPRVFASEGEEDLRGQFYAYQKCREEARENVRPHLPIFNGKHEEFIRELEASKAIEGREGSVESPLPLSEKSDEDDPYLGVGELFQEDEGAGETNWYDHPSDVENNLPPQPSFPVPHPDEEPPTDPSSALGDLVNRAEPSNRKKIASFRIPSPLDSPSDSQDELPAPEDTDSLPPDGSGSTSFDDNARERDPLGSLQHSLKIEFSDSGSDSDNESSDSDNEEGDGGEEMANDIDVESIEGSQTFENDASLEERPFKDESLQGGGAGSALKILNEPTVTLDNPANIVVEINAAPGADQQVAINPSDQVGAKVTSSPESIESEDNLETVVSKAEDGVGEQLVEPLVDRNDDMEGSLEAAENPPQWRPLNTKQAFVSRRGRLFRVTVLVEGLQGQLRSLGEDGVEERQGQSFQVPQINFNFRPSTEAEQAEEAGEA